MPKKFKFTYQLMAPGIKKFTTISDGKEVEVTWHVPHYSEPKYVVAPDEETALYEIRQKVKGKWLGFHFFPNFTVEV